MYVFNICFFCLAHSRRARLVNSRNRMMQDSVQYSSRGPCQDSQLHNVVIAVTVAYLISDALWILLQPDMASALRTTVNVPHFSLAKKVTQLNPTTWRCFNDLQCFSKLSTSFSWHCCSWGQNSKEHHCSPRCSVLADHFTSADSVVTL